MPGIGEDLTSSGVHVVRSVGSVGCCGLIGDDATAWRAGGHRPA